MAKKIINWKTKGMNKDMSVSSFSPEFAFENVNLRLATNEGNTMLSWVNERGTEEIDLLINERPWDTDSEYSGSTIKGTVLGTAVINHKLVLFTHETFVDEESAERTVYYVDRIYKFEYTDSNKTSMYGNVLYRGNLGFDTESPLETTVDYETEFIQKVYWTDGKNQPRLINIEASKEQLTKWNHQWNVERPTLDYYFDFVPSFDASKLTVTITNSQAAGGLFAPGVIQYCFTYINKYGQQSNVVYCSTLYYLSNVDRGASPTESISTVFNIKLSGLDNNFDYVRLYSIQRTSLNDTPIVKLLDDLPIEATLTGNVLDFTTYYVDNGTTGSTMDPTELLYVGGKEISALTMESKDSTLFLGNLKQKNVNVDSIQNYFIEHPNDTAVSFSRNKSLSIGKTGTLYSYNHTLGDNQKGITSFKGGEYYRFGFQLQKKDGEWVDPIYIKDELNTLYPDNNISGSSITAGLVSASASISIDAIKSAYTGKFDVFKKIRPVIVYPNINDRSVLCQGVLNPTVFNVEDRATHSPDAQPSWFFRPYHADTLSSGNGSSSGSSSSTSTSGIGVTVTSANFTSIMMGDISPSEVNDGSNAFNTSRGYFVIVGYVRNEKISEVLSLGKLKYKEDSTSRVGYAEFVGVIMLDNEYNSYYTKYAFFGNTAFPTSVRHDNNKQYLYYEDLTNVEYSSGHFDLYSTLGVTSSRYFYYYRAENSDKPANYKLKFFTDGKDWNDYQESSLDTDYKYGPGELYTVTFEGQAVASAEVVVANNSGGSALRFGHYESLYSDNEAGYNTAANVKQVEIQGSINKYPSVTPTEAEKTAAANINSNTQFFIDQSIVTLNSPDLEFDTTVQKFNTAGLKLRIIGAIPLTATASSHTIKTSSAMLETNYESDNNDSSITRKFGTGERNINIVSTTKATAYKRLVAESLWNDAKVTVTVEDENTIITTDARSENFTVYPWHRTGPLNNDPRGRAEASSFLQYKRMANLWFSEYSSYLTINSNGADGTSKSINTSGVQIPLTENAEVMNYRLGSNLNYYANIDKVLVNGDGYNIKVGPYAIDENKTTDAISMKYKSTTHAAISLGNSILPSTTINGTSVGAYTNNARPTFWQESKTFSQQSINNPVSAASGFLWLGELYRDNNTVSNRFGGTSKSALLSNKWVPAGEAVNIPSSGNVSLNWTEGDTYYQRYDCLKTYPFTEDDSNQIIEILSFMCETHVNIDGRYDRNRGMVNNVNVRPTNFNLLNQVYSQKNNFFTFRKLDTEDRDKLFYPNTITYSKSKQSGADVDLWANVTLASTLEMDGDKGEVTSINRFNNQLISFQDSGIAQILFNDNTMLSTTQGAPVEIANSGKVQGKTYISNTIGCSNKWSIAQTPSGIYFMDNNDKSIYLFNGQLTNLSTSKGFNSWCKQNLPSSEVKWNPVDYSNFVTYYDKLNQEVLFINKDTALAYSEKLGNFTSFYDYGKTPYFENLDDTGVWINDKIWKHQAGEFCQFFGVNKPYSMTLVGNQEPLLDKIFTNMEFRACSYGEGTYTSATGKFVPTTPFDTLEAWNEYQHGITELSLRASGSSSVKASLERKFRIWRCDIPRDNAALNKDFDGIKRFKVRPLDRMRNPWVYLKLEKNAAEEDDVLRRTEIHDMMAIYFG